MIDEDARRSLADLALRALDRISSDYGEDAELVAASLVFEVKTRDEVGDDEWHGCYESLPGLSPHHVSGLLDESARQMML